MIKFNAIGDKLILSTPRSVNSGSYGYYTLEFTFDEEWEDLVPHIVVIENGVQRADEVIVDNVHKLTTTECGVIMIGVYGLDSNGKKCLSSDYECIEVKKGAYTGGFSMPKDIWDAYQQVIIGYVERAEEAQAHGPIIGSNGNWYLWDVVTKKYKDTGVNASGGSSSGDGANDFIVTADLVDNEDIPTIENVSTTFDEIKDAYQKGQNIVLKINYFGHAEVTVAMTSIASDEAYFALTQGVLPHLAEIFIREEGVEFFVTRFTEPYEVENYVTEKITEALKGISSTSASDTTPLMDGTASAGQETAYARGDHRHPTDTTRVSVVAFNQYKKDLASDLSDEFESIRRIFALKSEVEDLASIDYVDNAIGDVETALENIVKKYGLGGEAQ